MEHPKSGRSRGWDQIRVIDESLKERQDSQGLALQWQGRVEEWMKDQSKKKISRAEVLQKRVCSRMWIARGGAISVASTRRERYQ